MGYQVTLRDIDAAKVAALNDGQVPIYEPGLVNLMAEHRDRLTYTLSLQRMLDMSDIVFIAVDTPPTYSGDADLSRVMGVVEELEQVGTGANHVLVMKSTVPVGTGERVRAELDARGPGRRGLLLQPGVPQGGRRDRGLPPARPRRDRRLRRRARRPGGGPLHAPSARRSCAPACRRPRWSSTPRTRSSPPRSASSTRSRTSARRSARTSRWSPTAWASTRASAARSCAPASASAAAASRRTSRPSSSSPATRATTSSCSPR